MRPTYPMKSGCDVASIAMSAVDTLSMREVRGGALGGRDLLVGEQCGAPRAAVVCQTAMPPALGGLHGFAATSKAGSVREAAALKA